MMKFSREELDLLAELVVQLQEYKVKFKVNRSNDYFVVEIEG